MKILVIEDDEDTATYIAKGLTEQRVVYRHALPNALVPVLTILGMTYADNDLIQIQENVIARAISSTDFNVH